MCICCKFLIMFLWSVTRIFKPLKSNLVPKLYVCSNLAENDENKHYIVDCTKTAQNSNDLFDWNPVISLCGQSPVDPERSRLRGKSFCV